MIIYLKDKETKTIQRIFTNINSWGYNFVDFENNGRCKLYCGETEYFTDKEVEENDRED